MLASLSTFFMRRENDSCLDFNCTQPSVEPSLTAEVPQPVIAPTYPQLMPGGCPALLRKLTGSLAPAREVGDSQSNKRIT